jgi:hypothetical protein
MFHRTINKPTPWKIIYTYPLKNLQYLSKIKQCLQSEYVHFPTREIIPQLTTPRLTIQSQPSQQTTADSAASLWHNEHHGQPVVSKVPNMH